MTRRHTGAAVATLTVLAGIFACTLYPFEFRVQPAIALVDILSIGFGRDLGPDIFGNVVLFLPLGLTLSAYWQDRAALLTLGAVLLASLCVSYGIEVAQLFVPGRFASLTDVVANIGGGALGYAVWCSWAGLRGRRADVAFAAYILSLALTSIALQSGISLKDWEPLPLSIGNEVTGDRPWKGRVLEFVVLDRSLSRTEVSRWYRRGAADQIPAGSVIAWYSLEGPCPCPDVSGHLPPLTPRALPDEARGTDAEDTVAPWFVTTGTATYLVSRTQQTSRVTLAASMATADRVQGGPASIVSMSMDTLQRNFMLGQSGPDLIVRFRMPFTGTNGSMPALRVPGVFSSGAIRRVVVTYDGLNLLAYVDGSRGTSVGLRYGLGAAAFAPFFGGNERAFQRYEVLYYALAFLPAGALAWRAARWRFPSRSVTLLCAASLVVPPLALETILVLTSGRVMSWLNLVLGITCATAGAVVCALAARVVPQAASPQR